VESAANKHFPRFFTVVFSKTGIADRPIASFLISPYIENYGRKEKS